MSPRMEFEVQCECPYVVCEHHYSRSRGIATSVYVCRHPDNAECWCVLNTFVEGECEFCPEGKAVAEEEEEKRIE